MGGTCCTHEEAVPRNMGIRRNKFTKSTDSDSEDDAHDVFAAVLGLPNSGKASVVKKFHDIFGIDRKPTELKDEEEQEEHQHLKQNDINQTEIEYESTNFIFHELSSHKSHTYNIEYIKQNHFNCIIILINGLEWNMARNINLKVDKQDCFGNKVHETLELDCQSYYIGLVKQLDDNLPQTIPFLIFVMNHSGNFPPESPDSNYAYLKLDELQRSHKIMTVDIKKDDALVPGLKYLNEVMFYHEYPSQINQDDDENE